MHDRLRPVGILLQHIEEAASPVIGGVVDAIAALDALSQVDHIPLRGFEVEVAASTQG